jgi:hypothetical protein
MSHMIVQYVEISRNSNKDSSRHNKYGIINVTKAAVRKSTLTQIPKAKAASLFH